ASPPCAGCTPRGDDAPAPYCAQYSAALRRPYPPSRLEREGLERDKAPALGVAFARKGCGQSATREAPMEYGAAAKNNRPSNSGRATLNEVLCAELEQLRPALLKGIAAKTFADKPHELTENLASIYGRSKSASLSAICLSGGGIRSATFNLGVLQGLAKIGLLGKFDYLSSVSGGGYIASWLRTWMSRENIAD